LRRAFDLGVNFFDTSGVYGNGHSERMISEALGMFRPQIIIATKAGLLDAQGNQDFSPKHIRQSLEASLDRLHTEYVDLFLLHSPPLDVLKEDPGIIAKLQDLQKEGKVRAFGISLRSPDDGLAAVTEFGFKSIQVNFNLVDQRALENGLFDLCEEHGVGIIVRTPLCFGFLTGAYSADSRFETGDHRSGWSGDQIGCWASASQLFSETLEEDRQQSDAQMSLRYCLSYPCVSTVIPGMLTTEQVEENTLASQMGPLSETELRAMKRTYLENTFFLGK